MYESFYGLNERPFSLTPDPRFLFMTPGHREALSNLTYGIASARAITLLTGEAGTGKTTLLRTALAKAGPNTEYVLVSNPTLTRAEFVHFVASKLKMTANAAQSKSAWLLELEQLLRERHARGMTTALLLDEAQSLPIELLEEVRLLSNIETDTEKLLPIVLVGQPELAARINEPSLRQLKQRVALRCELTTFDKESTARYIANRIRVAGGTPAQIFTRDAVLLIHQASRGLPRTINVLCDNALLSGFATNERPVGSRIVSEVCRDFQVDEGSGPGTDGPSPAPEATGERGAEDQEGAAGAPAAPGDALPETPPPTDNSDDREIFASIGGRGRRVPFLWMKS